MDWQKYYHERLVSADEAVQHVKSGDTVVFTTGREPLAMGLALAARKEELRGVKVLVRSPTFDFGWYDRGWEESFSVQIAYCFPRGVAAECLAEKRTDFVIPNFMISFAEADSAQPDFLLIEISPPDEHGFCSFGASVYDKRERVANAKTVLAEVNDRLVRTCGDNFVHVSQIDYFVEHAHTGRTPGKVSLSGQVATEPAEYVKQIAQHVATLIKNGDTLQIGAGSTSEALVRAGLLKDKQDIGWHSEVTPAGIIRLVRDGVVTGKCKTIDRGKAVATAMGGGTIEDMQFVHMNPMFELRDIEYTHNPRTLSAIDNLICINNALEVDLTGQVNAESIGPREYSGPGGLLAFAIGANMSRGGRSIIVLPSTAKEGTISRIKAMFDQGTTVTVPRNLLDIVVTEYGIARLRGKTLRQRAEQLIAIAHPDFRQKLTEAAKNLYWP